MKIIFTIDRKTGEMDYLIREDKGPTPPIINPPKHLEPKDTGPPEPKQKPKPN